MNPPRTVKMERDKTFDEARKPRVDGEQSRERLLLAAMRLFGEQGYAKTSIRQIAQAAGANVAAISYYFGDKASLYRAAFTWHGHDKRSECAAFDQPHFTLREALAGFYGQMLEPLKEGYLAKLFLRLWFREMVEPTGLWEQRINQGIRPMHQALVGMLARHLGMSEPDDRLHRLAYAIAALSVHLMVSRELIESITPHLLDSPQAVEQWIAQLVGFAEAMVLSQQSPSPSQTQGNA
ncbi:MAG: CerR family C-terminal domain-containing protein [Pseudomonadota bacterium]